MPDTYHVKLSDGREFNVTTEGGAPSEADVLANLPAVAAKQTVTAERKDANIIGVDHNWIADKASKLPEWARYPAAFAGSLIGSAAESLSAPENVATLGLGGASVPTGTTTVSDAARGAAGVVGKGMQVVGDINLTHPFKSTVGKMGEALEASAKAGPADAPRIVETAQEAVRRLQSQSAATKPIMQAASEVHAAATASKVKLTLAEFQEASRLVQKGMTKEKALESIASQRALLQKFKGLPTTQAAADEVASRP